MSHSIGTRAKARSASAASTALVLMAISTILCLAFAGPAVAKVLDFGAALQPLPAGTILDRVKIDEHGWMRVECRNEGDGPDVCIVFDSADPTGGDNDLGTPNEDFGGPGEGEGGERDGAGPNREALGKLIIVPDNICDPDGDGLVDVPNDEADGGVVTLTFSHAGRLSFKLVDVDRDEDEPRFFLYHGEDLIGILTGESPGDNSVQKVDLADEGDIDKIKIALGGSAGIADVKLDVMQVGIEPSTWSAVKGMFR